METNYLINETRMGYVQLISRVLVKNCYKFNRKALLPLLHSAKNIAPSRSYPTKSESFIAGKDKQDPWFGKNAYLLLLKKMKRKSVSVCTVGVVYRT